MNDVVTTVFGGTGFLGSRIVRALARADNTVRTAARNPDSERFSDVAAGHAIPVHVDIRDEAQVKHAVEGATAAVNAVSLYVEKNDATFEDIHVHGAEKVARAARDAPDQLMLVSKDNVVGKGVATFADLGIEPQRLEDLVDQCLVNL